jgi:glycosyltransferase involved in cell wall biosynthesis
VIFCSYIIPTIGRSTLDVAVKSVLEQNFVFEDFEVIIVNDSGITLTEKDWFQSARVRILNTHRSERSNARNAGAAAAKGQYLAFLDDDDWILPGALQSFWHLVQQQPEAVWLYGGIRIVDEQGVILGEINSGLNGNRFAQFMGGSWAPLQSSMLLASAFFEVGGFNPLITGTEDEDLTRRFAYQGTFANTTDTVACLFRGQSWNTSTNYLRAPEDTKYSRDLILSKPQVYRRLWTSADTNYWKGRVIRVYLSTILWNIKRKRIWRAISRSMYTLAGLFRSIRHIFSSQFWLGMRAEHVPDTLHFVMQEYEHKAQQQKAG